MSLLAKYEPVKFTQWFSENEEELAQEFSLLSKGSQDCVSCDGSGQVECDMGHEHDCDECHGEGKVEFTLCDYAMGEYRLQVSTDKAVIEKYDKFMKEFVSCQ